MKLYYQVYNPKDFDQFSKIKFINIFIKIIISLYIYLNLYNNT